MAATYRKAGDSLSTALSLIGAECHLSDIFQSSWFRALLARRSTIFACVVIGWDAGSVLPTVDIVFTHHICAVSTCLDNPCSAFSVLWSWLLIHYWLFLSFISCSWDVLRLVVVEIVVQKVGTLELMYGILCIVFVCIVTQIR